MFTKSRWANINLFDTGAVLETQKAEKIYVAGDYTSINGELINRIQRLNNDGTVP